MQDFQQTYTTNVMLLINDKMEDFVERLKCDWICHFESYSTKCNFTYQINNARECTMSLREKSLEPVRESKEVWAIQMKLRHVKLSIHKCDFQFWYFSMDLLQRRCQFKSLLFSKITKTTKRLSFSVRENVELKWLFDII